MEGSLGIVTQREEGLIALRSRKTQINVRHFNCFAGIECAAPYGHPGVRAGSSRYVFEMHIADLPQRVRRHSRFTTVALINHHRIRHIHHHNVLIHNVLRLPCICPNERLDSRTVGGADECAVGDFDSTHTPILRPLPQASHADAVAGAARDVGDGDVGGAFSDGYAVVPCCDHAARHVHRTAIPEVHSVGVGTVSWGCYVQTCRCEVVASVQVEVELHGV